MDSEPKPMNPERLAEYRRSVDAAKQASARVFPIYAWHDVESLLDDRDHHALRAAAAERDLAAINNLGLELAKVLGEDDPHHPLDVLAASVMHQLREARAEVARLRACAHVEDEPSEE
jgi:predicted nucleotidyltransferase